MRASFAAAPARLPARTQALHASLQSTPPCCPFPQSLTHPTYFPLPLVVFVSSTYLPHPPQAAQQSAQQFSELLSNLDNITAKYRKQVVVVAEETPVFLGGTGSTAARRLSFKLSTDQRAGVSVDELQKQVRAGTKSQFMPHGAYAAC